MAKSPTPKHPLQRHIRRTQPPLYADLPDWLTLNEAGAYLRLGWHAIRTRIMSGDIPSRKFGAQYRIAKESLRP